MESKKKKPVAAKSAADKEKKPTAKKAAHEPVKHEPIKKEAAHKPAEKHPAHKPAAEAAREHKPAAAKPEVKHAAPKHVEPKAEAAKPEVKPAAPKVVAHKPAAAKPAVARAPKTHGKPSAHGVGRRKSACARVWLYRGEGKIIINGRDYLNYFDTQASRSIVALPSAVVPHADRFNAEVNVQGGGLKAQSGAVQLGIARAFLNLDEELRSVLRQHKLLTVDSRVKERKKYGQKAARRRFQFVKR